MSNYRSEFYRAYAATHTIPRKGRLTPARLEARRAEWDQQIAPLLPDNHAARVLDVGCGDGVLLWWLQNVGFLDAEGVEVAADQVQIAKALGVKGLHEGDVMDFLEAHEQRYEVLVMRNLLEHFEKPEVLRVLQLAYRALMPGGRVILQVPNAESPFFGRIRYGDFTHGLAFCRTSLAQLFEVCGFADYRFLPVRPVFPGLKGVPRRLLWRTVESIYKLLLTAELGGGGAFIVTQDILTVAYRRS